MTITHCGWPKSDGQTPIMDGGNIWTPIMAAHVKIMTSIDPSVCCLFFFSYVPELAVIMAAAAAAAVVSPPS